MDELGPMTLRPGDRRIRSISRDLPPSDDPWWIERSCDRCSLPVEAGTAAIVRYGHESDVVSSAAVCASCAVQLTPVRVVVDADSVQELDLVDPLARRLVGLVDRVLRLRAEPPDGPLCLRSQDVTILAARNDTTRTQLALELDRLGVLAGVDIATGLLVGPVRGTGPGPRAGSGTRAHDRTRRARPSLTTPVTQGGSARDEGRH